MSVARYVASRPGAAHPAPHSGCLYGVNDVIVTDAGSFLLSTFFKSKYRQYGRTQQELGSFFPAAGLPLMGRLPPALLLCVEVFLAGGERLRQMTPCDGWRPLQGVERRLAVRASLVGGALRKSANRRVARPRVFLQRKRRVSAGLTSLSPCSLSARQNV